MELSFANENELFLDCARFNSVRVWCDISPTQVHRGLKNWHLVCSYNPIYPDQDAEMFKT